MRKTAARVGHLGRAGGGLLFVAGLIFLTGCQGVSIGAPSEQQKRPGTLSLANETLHFGNGTARADSSLSETVTNTGGATVTISQITIRGTGFSLSGITAPVTLAAGQSTSFRVAFSQTSAASASGSVTITSNASNPTLTVPLSATTIAAYGVLTVNPSALALGNVVVGSSGTASATLTANGASVTVTAVNTNDGSMFSPSGLSLPVTIAAGESVPFTVSFSPQTTGAASSTLTFTSNAQPSSTTEVLTGTGTARPTHTVNLSWEASTSNNISGYNIYRAVYSGSCGSFSKISAEVITGTVYTDFTVMVGTAYCYGVKAVNAKGEESDYSNIVINVQILAPPRAEIGGGRLQSVTRPEAEPDRTSRRDAELWALARSKRGYYST